MKPYWVMNRGGATGTYAKITSPIAPEISIALRNGVNSEGCRVSAWRRPTLGPGSTGTPRRRRSAPRAPRPSLAGSRHLLSKIPVLAGLHALGLSGHLRVVRRVRQVAEPPGFVLCGHLEQRFEGVVDLVDRGVRVAAFPVAGGHGSHREVVGRDVRQLVPRQRRRDGCDRRPPDRPGRRDRAVARVLVVVDEHCFASLLLPPGRRDQAGRTALDLAGKGDRGSPHLDEGPARLDSYTAVDAATAARLREADVA